MKTTKNVEKYLKRFKKFSDVKLSVATTVAYDYRSSNLFGRKVSL